MDRVNKVNQVVGIFKSRIEGPSKSTKTRQTNQAKTRSDLTIETSKSIDTLKEKLRRRLKTVDKTKPGYQDKLQRIYIESTLTHELGGDISNDIAFAAMVTDIRQQILHHPSLKNKLNLSIASLLAESD